MIQITYTLVSELTDARHIARTLVEEKLATCVNIFPNVLSVYKWKDEVTESHEFALFIKSDPQNQEILTNRLKQLHPYELPAILSGEANSTLEFEKYVKLS